MNLSKSFLLAAVTFAGLATSSAYAAGDIDTLVPKQSSSNTIGHSVVKAAGVPALNIDTLVARDQTTGAKTRTQVRGEVVMALSNKSAPLTYFWPANI